MGKFEIRRAISGFNRYYWYLVSKDGEMLARSKGGYVTRWSAKRGVRRFVKLASAAEVAEV